jgi:hypothetical protein
VRDIYRTLTVVLLVATCGPALADVSPTVTLIWSAGSPAEYVYEIHFSADSTSSLGYFQVNTDVLCQGEHALYGGTWDLSGPWVYNPVSQMWEDKAWLTGIGTWAYDSDLQPLKDFAYWRATRTQEVLPGEEWTGHFKLYVPNTEPGPGKVLTKNYVAGLTEEHDRDVPSPGSTIPEASGFVGLGTGVLLAVGAALGRRR